MVKPDKIDDLAAVRLVRDIVKRIEQELEYPGQIKVVVIRKQEQLNMQSNNKRLYKSRLTILPKILKLLLAIKRGIH